MKKDAKEESLMWQKEKQIKLLKKSSILKQKQHQSKKISLNPMLWQLIT